MATNDKLNSLKKYAEDVRQKLKSPMPSHKKSSEESYFGFWERELRKTESKIERLSLSGVK
jgi:hypothetical protein